jgi:hypothetical protein
LSTEKVTEEKCVQSFLQGEILAGIGVMVSNREVTEESIAQMLRRVAQETHESCIQGDAEMWSNPEADNFQNDLAAEAMSIITKIRRFEKVRTGILRTSPHRWLGVVNALECLITGEIQDHSLAESDEGLLATGALMERWIKIFDECNKSTGFIDAIQRSTLYLVEKHRSFVDRVCRAAESFVAQNIKRGAN